jgi:hypothetical protein
MGTLEDPWYGSPYKFLMNSPFFKMWSVLCFADPGKKLAGGRARCPGYASCL